MLALAIVFSLIRACTALALPTSNNNPNAGSEMVVRDVLASSSELANTELSPKSPLSHRRVARDEISGDALNQSLAPVPAQVNQTVDLGPLPWAIRIPKGDFDVSIIEADKSTPIPGREIQFVLDGLEINLHEKDPNKPLKTNSDHTDKTLAVIVPFGDSLTNGKGALAVEAVSTFIGEYQIFCALKFVVHGGHLGKVIPPTVGSGVLQYREGAGDPRPVQTAFVAVPATDLIVLIQWDTSTSEVDPWHLDWSMHNLQNILYKSPDHTLDSDLRAYAYGVTCTMAPKLIKRSLQDTLSYMQANQALEAMHTTMSRQGIFRPVLYSIHRRTVLVAMGGVYRMRRGQQEEGDEGKLLDGAGGVNASAKGALDGSTSRNITFPSGLAGFED